MFPVSPNQPAIPNGSASTRLEETLLMQGITIWRTSAARVLLTVGIRGHFEFGILLKRYLEEIAMHAGAVEGKDLAALSGQTKIVHVFGARQCLSICYRRYSHWR